MHASSMLKVNNLQRRYKTLYAAGSPAGLFLTPDRGSSSPFTCVGTSNIIIQMHAANSTHNIISEPKHTTQACHKKKIFNVELCKPVIQIIVMQIILT
jgi:hypothetical protein